MADIIGMFDLVSTEGLDNYLKTVGVNFLLRKLAGSVTNAQMEITKAGNEYIIKNINKIKSSEVKFRLGEEVKETTMDGREVISTFTLDGNTLKQVQRGIKDEEFVSTIDREITADGLTLTIRYKDATAIRKYKRL